MRWLRWCSDSTGVGLDGSDELGDHALHPGHLTLEHPDPIRAGTSIECCRSGRRRILGRLLKDTFDTDLLASTARRVLGTIAPGLLLATGVAGAMHS